ncbi:hypothetical protein FZ934_07990 [Rhizobium grahamii]|uniref:Uncharacterized protein n=1 Tax=Rhizobium grahamii TaxID=1120045 RepID=A0A5Q0C3B1_9HYPH|nr:MULTISPECIES: hypothetical protein [Rhizobium]QFY60376.1 hypothetical protein FZ934_07990 [Rhizobium grahamii]QRM50497.1 hypothetical protein F3Y33_14900 [Rhizobium sp. BG6]
MTTHLLNLLIALYSLDLTRDEILGLLFVWVAAIQYVSGTKNTDQTSNDKAKSKRKRGREK